MQKKLSICVVTMNRAIQLREALESCLACELPKQTEFIIIDNASTDETEDVVRKVLDNCSYSYYYEKLAENIGAGGGRNLYFLKAQGKYVYGMDDDAIIDYSKNSDFFIRAVEIMDANPTIVSLATQIYDKAWGCNRQSISGKEVIPGIYKCKMFSGGSHFLSKDFFKEPPYLSNKYGYEELPPSLRAYDAGKINAFFPDLLAIHQPIVDKWDYSKKDNYDLIINECAIPYAIKRIMYPNICGPILWLAFQIRCKKYLPNTEDAKSKAKKIVNDTIMNYRMTYKIKLSTIVQLYKDFGPSIF
jgi:glycosyltransferase involved in cell wall biosynthesis